jgi:hypothetical protein
MASVVAPTAGTGVGVAAGAPLTLPSPDPLAGLLSFDVGGLQRVLAYILENLKTSNERLTKLEANVSTLNDTTVVHGDSIAALKALLLTFKPGGGDDMDELREKVAQLSGRVDSQSAEISSLSAQGALHARSLEGLAASTSALEALMPTKADVSELATKASRATVERHERELEDLSAQVKQDHESRISILEAGLKRLSAAVDALQQDDFKDEALRRITELEDGAKLTVAHLAEHDRRLDELGALVDTKAAQAYVDTELENLLARLRELELALAASMKGELKRFERDVMIYVSDQLAGLNHGNNHGAGVGAGGGGGGGGGGMGSGSSGGANGIGAGSGVFHAHSHTAAGRMHFRCLTCDRPHDSVPGAQTFRYASAQGKQQVMSGAGVIPSESRLLELQLGEQVYLHGSDGNIYRGREPPSHQQQMLLQQSASSSNNGPLVPALPSSSGELMRLVSPSNASTHRSGSPDKYTSASALASARAGKSRPTSADPSRSHAQGRQQIDPASGRRSSEHMQLPLSSITAMAMGGGGGGEADSKEQWAEASSSTSRALHFPSPVKSGGAGGGGGVSSGYSTSRAAISLHRASSNADLSGGGGGGGGQGSASPGGSPLASVRTRQARPSTAQARTNAGATMADTSGGGGGGHVLVGKVAQTAAPAASRTRGGVELVNDPSDDS